jgi:hypothetical protein
MKGVWAENVFNLYVNFFLNIFQSDDSLRPYAKSAEKSM